MTIRQRFLRFNGVGTLGVLVQLGVVALLVNVAHVHYGLATGIGVSTAIVHNFLWHRGWTWQDRRLATRGSAAFGRFVLTNGAISLGGNLILMTLLVGLAGLPVLAANALAIAACGLLNYWVSDTVVFS